MTILGEHDIHDGTPDSPRQPPPDGPRLSWFALQFLNQATSMDGLKKSDGYRGSLLAHFYSEYGPAESDSFKAAQRRFMVSLAG